MNVAFLETTDQYYAFLEAGPKSSSLFIATSSLEIMHMASKRGISCIDLEGYLNADEYLSCKKIAYDYADALSSHFQEPSFFGGCDLFRIMRFDLVRALIFALSSGMAIQRMLEEFRIEHAWIFKERRKARYWDTWYYPDIFNAQALRWCNSFNIPITTLSLADTSAKLLNGALHGITDQRIRADRKQVFSREAFDAILSDEQVLCSDKPRVLCYAEGLLGVNEQWALLEEAQSCVEYQWLAVVETPCELKLPQIILEDMRKLPFRLPLSDSVMNCAQWGEICSAWKSINRQAVEYLDTEYLAFILTDYCVWVRHGALHLAVADLLYHSYRPSVVVLNYPVFGYMRVVSECFKRHGVDVLAVHHGGVGLLSGLNRYDGYEGTILTWGELDTRFLRNYKFHPDTNLNVIMTGSLRRDHIHPGQGRAAKNSGDVKKQTSALSILIVTAPVTASYIGYASVSKNREDWGQLEELFRAHPDWIFSVKPHPGGDYYEWYEDLQQQWPDSVTIDRRTLDESLASSDVVVLFNTPSSVAFDALQRGVPVLYLTSAISKNEKAILDYVDAVSTCKDVKEVERCLNACCASVLSFVKTDVGNEDACRQIVCRRGRDAAQAVIDIIDNKVSKCEPTQNPEIGLLTILSMMRMIEGGYCSLGTFREKFASACAKYASGGGAGGFSSSSFGKHLIESIIWRMNTEAIGFSKHKTLHAVLCGMPDEMRPSMKGMLGYRSEALLEDAKSAKSMIIRSVLTVMAWMLSPRSRWASFHLNGGRSHG